MTEDNKLDIETEKKDKISFKNMEDDEELVIESSDDEIDDTVVNLAGKNYATIPKSNNDDVRTLILTKNKIQSLKNLETYPNIETLQLDNNGLKSIQGMPKLLKLKTLWLNNNSLTNLNQLLTILKKQTPKLTYLSLLKNPLCPDIFFGHDTAEIKTDEKQQATKKGKYLIVAKPDAKQMLDTSDNIEDDENDDTNIEQSYKNAQPAAFLGKGKIKYDGRESEGNRFILNTDL